KSLTGVTLKDENTCFVRTKTNEVFAIDGEKRAVHPLPFTQTSSFHSDALYYDTIQHRLYVTGFLRFWDEDKDKWKFVLPPKEASKILSTKPAISTFNVKVSNYDDKRLLFFDNFQLKLGTRSSEAFFFDQDYKAEPQQRIFDAHQCYSGKIFVAGTKGLYEFNANTKQFIKHNEHPTFNHRIQKLIELPDSTLVVGTRFDGIVLWKNEKVQHISTKEGLSSPYIRALHVDSSQNLWVGTNRGLDLIQVTADTFNIQGFTISDGLPSNEINSITSKGKQVWVATSNGAVKMPMKLPPASTAVQPYIERFLVNGKERILTAAQQLKWQENNLQISVAALDYRQAERIPYRYRFSQNEHWQYSYNPKIDVAKVAYGKYNFEVQAKGRDGRWSNSTFLSICIQAPLWRRLWMQIFVLITLLICFWIWWKRREIVRKERHRKAKQLVLLKQEIENLRQQAYRAQMNPHFIFNCLTAIQSFVLQEEKGQLIASDYLSKFAKLIRQSLEVSREESVILRQDIELLQHYVELEHFRFNHNFDYEFIIDASIDTYHIQIPPLLIQPYVENAIIHGFTNIERRGNLKISYSQVDQMLVIQVKDNGTGIYESQRKQKSKDRKHRSMGLDISKKRLSIQSRNTIQEDIVIEEMKEAHKVMGTCVTIRVPIF
ncbi:MAG: histidine kinase, partial [Bacteroidota bacterium]